MTLADLLRETIDLPDDGVWENERTLTAVRVFGVRLHSIGLSVREVAAVLDLLGVDRSHGTVWILSVLIVALFSIGRNIAQLGRSPSTKDMFTSA